MELNGTHPIVLEHVGVSFGTFDVHKDITLAIDEGEVVTILGPSGSGKTVILKLMIGLLFPTRGKVTVFGSNLIDLDDEGLRKIRMNIGMLFQGAALFDSLSVYENIAYSLREAETYSDSEIADIVNEKLKLINLPGIGHKFPPELSGGQKKRVGLARALASSPKIVLFDEPTTGLDPTSARLIDDLIVQLREEFGITSVVVTHDIGSASRVSNRWVLINQGRVIADGTVADLSEKNEDVIRFIKGNWYENNK